MIKSIRHKGLRRFHEAGSTAKVNPAHIKKLRLILTLLEAAKEVKDMDFPGSSLHSLKGEYEGFHAVSVSGNWRIIFRLENADIYDVDYLDYH